MTFIVITLNHELTLCAERRIIPNTTSIHWRCQADEWYIGCVAGIPCRRFLERWCESKLIGLMDRIHAVHNVEWKNLQTGYTWSGRRLTKIKQQESLIKYGQKFLSRMSETVQQREQQQWAIERPKCDKAGKLRGIYFIDPNEGTSRWIHVVRGAADEKSGNIKARLFVARDLVRNVKNNSTNVLFEKPKIDNAHASTRTRTEKTQQKDHEDHTAGEGVQLVASLKSCAQVHSHASNNENPGCESNSGQRIGKAWTIAGLANDQKIKSKTEVMKEAHKEQRTVHFATLMDICHLKKAQLEPKYQKYKGRVVLRNHIVKDSSRSDAVFTK